MTENYLKQAIKEQTGYEVKAVAYEERPRLKWNIFTKTLKRLKSLPEGEISKLWDESQRRINGDLLAPNLKCYENLMRELKR